MIFLYRVATHLCNISIMENCCVRFVTESGDTENIYTNNVIFVTCNIFLLPVTRYKNQKNVTGYKKNVVSNKKQHWRHELTF